jgi:iron complex outermembrane receptor protein
MSPLKSQVMAGDGHMKVQGIIVGVASIVLGVNATTQELAIEEIVVTATKRAESVQDIPLAVTAFTGAQLEEAGVKDIRDIAGQTPGLSITARGETEGNVFIRGIGSVAPGIGADPAVGLYIDGLYAARGTNVLAAFFDVERVEVVKGPQGTLFGRNASAGAISIITRKPEIGENSGSALLGYGDEGQQKYEFIYNAGIGESTAVRFGVKHDRRDGLYENSVTGEQLNGRNHTNARLSVLHDTGNAYNTHFSVEYIDVSNTAGFATLDDLYAPSIAQNAAPAEQTIESLRVNWTNNWDLNDRLSLSSITGYYTHDVVVTPVDADLIDFFVADFQEPQDADFFSQEFRLNGGGTSLDWFVGASYVQEELGFRNELRYDEFVVADVFGLNALDADNGDICDGSADFGDGNGTVAIPVCLPLANEMPRGDGETTSVAMYGDMTWHMSDRFDLNFGVRYTEDDKSIVYDNPPTAGLLGALDGQIFGPTTPGPVTAGSTFDSVDPRLSLNMHISEGVMLYVSAAKGYKSGGLNRQYDSLTGELLGFDKEENTAYEAGIKSTIWGGRGQINAAVFANNYENFQLEQLINLVPQIDNVGDVEVSGAEVEFRFLLSEAVEIWGSIGLLDTKVVDAIDPLLNGNQTPRAPETSGSLGGTYSVPAGSGNFDALATWSYTDAFYFDLGNAFQQPSYSTVDARIAWSNPTWGIALAGENLADQEYLVEQFLFLDVTSQRGWGRLVRVELNLNF